LPDIGFTLAGESIDARRIKREATICDPRSFALPFYKGSVPFVDDEIVSLIVAEWNENRVPQSQHMREDDSFGSLSHHFAIHGGDDGLI
jgi:hypothetical protein